MLKKETKKDSLPGCTFCNCVCKYNGNVTTPFYECGSYTESLYGCNSYRRETGNNRVSLKKVSIKQEEQ